MTEAVSRAAQYMRLKIVPQTRRLIKRVVDEEFQGVSERVKDLTGELVKDAMNEVIRLWEHGGGQSLRSSPAPDSAVATPEPRASLPPCTPPPALSISDAVPDTSLMLELDRAGLSLEQDTDDFLEQFLLPRYDDDENTGDSTYCTQDVYPLSYV